MMRTFLLLFQELDFLGLEHLLRGTLLAASTVSVDVPMGNETQKKHQS